MQQRIKRGKGISLRVQKSVILLLTFFGLGVNFASGQIGLLHSFSGGATDGGQPLGTLTLSGGMLYGMANSGGSKGFGTIFQVATDGSSFTLLHNFTNGTADDRAPSGSLILSGSTFYGVTSGGGNNLWGVVFRMNLDGSGYTNLHSFANVTSDGRSPFGSLLLAGSTLNGMTGFAGSRGNGTIFKINIDGTGFNLLHSFAGPPCDGSSPQGDLTIAGSTLYGTTYSGGSSYNGTVFSLLLNPTITSSAGSHGTIQPAGMFTVPSGSTNNFVITPNTYWHVTDVSTNGISAGASTSFTWPNISTDGSIFATFAPDLSVDGTPHWWLAASGWTNNFDAAEASDRVGDGLTAGQEYLAGTNPTDSASNLRILELRMTPPQIALLSSTNRLYKLCSRADLLVGNWVRISTQTDIPGDGNLQTLIDSNAPAERCFYRLSVRLP